MKQIAEEVHNSREVFKEQGEQRPNNSPNHARYNAQPKVTIVPFTFKTFLFSLVGGIVGSTLTLIIERLFAGG